VILSHSLARLERMRSNLSLVGQNLGTVARPVLAVSVAALSSREPGELRVSSRV
jgi:hypothetical protein